MYFVASENRSTQWLAHCRKKSLFLAIAFAATSPAVTAQQVVSWQNISIPVTGGGTLTYQVAQMNCTPPIGGKFDDYLEDEYRNLTYTSPTGEVGAVSPLQMSSGYPQTPAQETPPYTNYDGYDGICTHHYGWNSPVELDFTLRQSASSSVRTGNTADIAFNYVSRTATLLPVRFSLYPKYLVLSVIYAPPGAKSTVTYSKNMVGNVTTTQTSSFSNQNSESISAGFSLGISAVVANVSVSDQETGTVSRSYTAQSNSTKSTSITNTSGTTNPYPGPSDSSLGVDHDFDKIKIWLNPVNLMQVNNDGSALTWTGFGFNAADPLQEMDTIDLPVAWLKNPQLIPADVQTLLARSWDTTGQGALNAADYTEILKSDPFANTAYNPNSDSSHRFDLQTGCLVNNYNPPALGGQPSSVACNVGSQTVSTNGQGSSDTKQIGVGWDSQFKAGIIFAKVSLDFKASDTMTWTNTKNTLNSNTIGTTAALSIVGPTTTDNYTGPAQIQVWRDNVYGTFMFYPVQ